MSFAHGFSAALRAAYRPVDKWLHDQRFVRAMEAAEAGRAAKIEAAARAEDISTILDSIADRLR